MRDLTVWHDAWEGAYGRGLKRWRGVVRWAFSGKGGSRRQAAALRLVTLAARFEAGAVEARYWLGLPPPSGRGTGPA